VGWWVGGLGQEAFEGVWRGWRWWIGAAGGCEWRWGEGGEGDGRRISEDVRSAFSLGEDDARDRDRDAWTRDENVFAPLHRFPCHVLR
jgi:hypothetical protein